MKKKFGRKWKKSDEVDTPKNSKALVTSLSVSLSLSLSVYLYLTFVSLSFFSLSLSLSLCSFFNYSDLSRLSYLSHFSVTFFFLHSDFTSFFLILSHFFVLSLFLFLSVSFFSFSILRLSFFPSLSLQHARHPPTPPFQGMKRIFQLKIFSPKNLRSNSKKRTGGGNWMWARLRPLKNEVTW